MTPCPGCGWDGPSHRGYCGRCGRSLTAAPRPEPGREAPSAGAPSPPAEGPRSRAALGRAHPVIPRPGSGSSRARSRRSLLAGLALALCVGMLTTLAVQGVGARGGGPAGGPAATVSGDLVGPPPDSVARWAEPYLPAGMRLESVPVPQPPEADGAIPYRLSLRRREPVYRVAVVPLTAPAGVPGALAREIVAHPELGPGRTYADADATLAVDVPVTAFARVRRAPGALQWEIDGARPLVVADSAPATAPDVALLSAAELARAGAARDVALDRVTAGWREVRTEIEAFRAAALRDVPPRCARDTRDLLRAVVAEQDVCRVTPGDRSACMARRDALNREMGACQEQNESHETARAAADRAADAYAAERRAAFLREVRGRSTDPRDVGP